MATEGLQAIGLRTADIARAERFYTTVLGGTVRNRRDHPDRRVWVQVRGVTLEIAEVAAWPPLSETQRRALPQVGLLLGPDEVDAAMARLRAAGIPHHGPVLKMTGQSIGIYFSDPDGNLLSLSCQEGYPAEGLHRHDSSWVPGPYDW